MNWAYGVTTVPSRRLTHLPRTLASLAKAGFDKPRLFVDDCAEPRSYAREFHGLEVTARWPGLGLTGNWTLALWELWYRHPAAHRYAVFQDDLVAVRGLREYLERVPYPKGGYLNLYTDHYSVVEVANRPVGFHRGKVLCSRDLNPTDFRKVGEHTGYQMGRGALALVFDREAVVALLSQKCFVLKPQDPVNGWKKIDGAVVTAMNEAGFSEYVHNPGLVQHTGDVSTIGNTHVASLSFPGEHYDARRYRAGK